MKSIPMPERRRRRTASATWPSELPAGAQVEAVVEGAERGRGRAAEEQRGERRTGRSANGTATRSMRVVDQQEDAPRRRRKAAATASPPPRGIGTTVDPPRIRPVDDPVAEGDPPDERREDERRAAAAARNADDERRRRPIGTR